MAHVLYIKQLRSGSKLNPQQAATLKSLGLRGPGSKVIRQDLRAIRGMLNHVQHVIRAERIEESEAKKRLDAEEKSIRGFKIQA